MHGPINETVSARRSRRCLSSPPVHYLSRVVSPRNRSRCLCVFAPLRSFFSPCPLFSPLPIFFPGLCHHNGDNNTLAVPKKARVRCHFPPTSANATNRNT